MGNVYGKEFYIVQNLVGFFYYMVVLTLNSGSLWCFLFLDTSDDEKVFSKKPLSKFLLKALES